MCNAFKREVHETCGKETLLEIRKCMGFSLILIRRKFRDSVLTLKNNDQTKPSVLTGY